MYQKYNSMIYTHRVAVHRGGVFQVEVEVEAMDKGGNFIGWLFVDGVNLSVALVAEGLSKVHFTAERSSHYNVLCAAEKEVKGNKLNVSYNPPMGLAAEFYFWSRLSICYVGYV